MSYEHSIKLIQLLEKKCATILFFNVWENIITLHSLMCNNVLLYVHRKPTARSWLAE